MYIKLYTFIYLNVIKHLLVFQPFVEKKPKDIFADLRLSSNVSEGHEVDLMSV